eukprot:UN12802
MLLKIKQKKIIFNGFILFLHDGKCITFSSNYKLFYGGLCSCIAGLCSCIVACAVVDVIFMYS